jgi:hypothetical protein
MSYYQLLETFPQRGCVICNLLRDDVAHFLGALLYEFVVDKDVHQRIRASRGLCGEHGTQFARLGNALNIAVIYEAALAEVLKIMAHATSNSANWQRLFGQHPQANLLEALQPTQPCAACELQTQSAARYIGALSAALDNATLQAAFRASDGLCLTHFQATLRQTSDPTRAKILVDLQTALWRQLQTELREFIRKSEFEVNEPMTDAERESWRRTVARLSDGKQS